MCFFYLYLFMHKPPFMFKTNKKNACNANT